MKLKRKKFKQLVLVELENSIPWVEEIVSDSPIKIEDVTAFYVEREGFDEEKDGLTFLFSTPTRINLDTKEVELKK